eukprot:1754832-Heterocapsa_arctica.AAC.1
MSGSRSSSGGSGCLNRGLRVVIEVPQGSRSCGFPECLERMSAESPALVVQALQRGSQFPRYDEDCSVPLPVESPVIARVDTIQ